MATGAFPDVLDGVKDIYPTRMVRAMENSKRPFSRSLKKELPADAKQLDEGVARFLANMAPPQNIAQIGDAQALPAPKDRTEKKFTLKPTLFVGTYQVGWITKQAANSARAAFNRGEVARRTEETVENLAKHMERIYCGTHGTGRLARVASDGSNSFIADLPEGVQLLRPNMRISVRTTDGGAVVRDTCDFRLITAINRTTRSVSYSDLAGTGTDDRTLVAGDHVHLVAEAAQTLTGISANGLRGLVDDGTFSDDIQGLSRTTYPRLKALVMSNSGVLRNLTEQLMIHACNEVAQESGKLITHIWTNTGQVEKFVEFVAPDRRHVTKPGEKPRYVVGHGGAEDDTGLRLIAPGVDADIRRAFDIVAREMYFLSYDTFFHYQCQEMDWWDEGARVLKPVPTSGGFKAAFFAALSAQENIGIDMPIANLVMRDLRDPLIGDA